METIKVYSTIEDKDIKKNLNNSPVWRKAIHEDDLQSVKDTLPSIWEYQIQFDGLKPMFVSKVNKYK